MGRLFYCLVGIIVLWFERNVFYKFGASDDNFQPIRANQFLMWEATCRTQAKECSFYDFDQKNIVNTDLFPYKSQR